MKKLITCRAKSAQFAVTRFHRCRSSGRSACDTTPHPSPVGLNLKGVDRAQVRRSVNSYQSPGGLPPPEGRESTTPDACDGTGPAKCDHLLVCEKGYVLRLFYCIKVGNDRDRDPVISADATVAAEYDPSFTGSTGRSFTGDAAQTPLR